MPKQSSQAEPVPPAAAPLDLEKEALALDQQYAASFPVYHRALSLILLRRTFDYARRVEVPSENLAYWHKMLCENARLPVPGTQSASTPQGNDLLDLIWDVFNVTREERERRRNIQTAIIATGGKQ